jgi:putative membrane protein
MGIRSLHAMAFVLGGSLYFAASVSAQQPVPQGTERGQGSSPSATSTGSANASMPGSGTAAATTFTDAEILGVVMAVDSNEIAAADVAKKKKIGSEAKSYAKMLDKQHTANAKQANKLGKKLGMKPAASQTADQLRSKGKSDLATLSGKDGSEFEKGYIDAMVQGHTEALQLIDGQLMPSAKNDAVKGFLTETRGHVAAHLEQGKRLQGAQASNQGQ